MKRGIDICIDQLNELAPSGFSIQVHIRSALPLLNQQTFSKEWMDHYKRSAFALRDPIIAWGLSTSGTTRWSDIEIPDPFDIFGQFASFGMPYGMAVSCGPTESKTIAMAARQDREFDTREIGEFERLVLQLHRTIEPPKALTTAQIEALRCIAEGDRHAAAASRLGISESALKARLASARSSLLSRTTAEAIQRARDYRLL